MSARPSERGFQTWIAHNPDLSFAVLLAVCVYTYFALTNGLFATHNTAFAILERFAVLGPIGLSLTLCIIAGEIDLSVGSNAALAAVIVVRFADSLGAFNSLMLALAVSTLIGVLQGLLDRLSQSSRNRLDGRNAHATQRRRALCGAGEDRLAHRLRRP